MKRWRPLAISLTVLLLVGIGGYQLMNSRTFQLSGGLTARVETTEKVVALTFDDGPRCDRVEPVLAALDGTPATFFIVGEAAEKCPEALASLVEAGNELGNHTLNHRRMIFVSPDTVAAQIEPVDTLIRSAGQSGDIPVRPPYGKKLVVFPWWLAEHHRNTVTWDVESETFDGPKLDAATITAQSVEQTKPGSIILLHPWNPDSDALAAVPQVIERLKAQGYRFVTVSELLALQRS